MIPIGQTLGILGGGQLGRMTAMAARSLGYKIHALDPDPSCAARFVVEKLFTAGFDDEQAAEQLARSCSVVTLEIEKLSLSCLRTAERFAPVRPGPGVLGIVQDREVQKRWLETKGFPVGPWRAAQSAEEVAAAVQVLGSSIVKSATGGYDGRGQASLSSPDEAEKAWQEAGAGRVVVEKRLALRRELSVLVARSPSGSVKVYPPALNHHERGVLDWCVLPAPAEPALLRRARELARSIAETIGVEGLLAVELFDDGSLLVNELAPRPHNTFHGTEVACPTSQFEQAVRAVCDLPLGEVEPARPAAIANLLGELWLGPQPPAFEKALAVKGVRLHLYGKSTARAGRKMGHLSAIGETPEEALDRVLEARNLLNALHTPQK